MDQKKNIDVAIRNKIQDFYHLLRENNIIVDKIILYGSYAKGINRQGSDIDLCLVSELFQRKPEYYFKKIWHLAVQIDSAIEPIPFTPQELTDKYSTLSAEIIKHGIRVI